jgi:hypothetical protein
LHLAVPALAVVAFGRLVRSLVSLEAKLAYRNPNTNLFTRFFAAEYGAFFDVLLAGREVR